MNHNKQRLIFINKLIKKGTVKPRERRVSFPDPSRSQRERRVGHCGGLDAGGPPHRRLELAGHGPLPVHTAEEGVGPNVGPPARPAAEPGLCLPRQEAPDQLGAQ